MSKQFKQLKESIKSSKSLRRDERQHLSQHSIAASSDDGGLGHACLAKSLSDITKCVEGLIAGQEREIQERNVRKEMQQKKLLKDEEELKSLKKVLERSNGILSGVCVAGPNADVVSIGESLTGSVETSVTSVAVLAELQRMQKLQEKQQDQLQEQMEEVRYLKGRVERQDADVVKVWELSESAMKTDGTVADRTTSESESSTSNDWIAAAVSEAKDSIRSLTRGKVKLENSLKTLQRRLKERELEEGESTTKYVERLEGQVAEQQLSLDQQRVSLDQQGRSLQELQRKLEIVTLNMASLLVEGHSVIESTMRRADTHQLLLFCTITVLKCGSVFLQAIAEELLDSVKAAWPENVWVVVVARGEGVTVHASALPELRFQARFGAVTFTVYSPLLDQANLEKIDFQGTLDYDCLIGSSVTDELTEMYDHGVWQAVEGFPDDYAIECTDPLFNACIINGAYVWNGIGCAEAKKEKRKRMGSLGFMWMQKI